VCKLESCLTWAKWMRRTAVLVAPLLLSVGLAMGQAQPVRLGELGNDVQQPVAAAVQAVSDQFTQSFGTPDNPALTPEEADLFTLCLGLDQTANLLLGNGLPTDYAIPGITSLEDLTAALQQVGTEESAAEGTNVTETSRGKVLLKRLAAVRGGASGVTVTGLSLGVDGDWFEVAGVTHDLTLGRGDALSSPYPNSGAKPLAMPAEPGGAGDKSTLFPSERWGLFVNGMIGFGDKETTVREDGFDFTVPGLVLGVDYRFGNDLIFGGSVGYESFDGDFDVTPTVAGGDMQADLLSLSAYSSYYKKSFYVDGIATYGFADYEMTREIVYPTITRTAKADTDGSQLELTAAFGYIGQRESFQYSPFLRVSHESVDIDDYVESEGGGATLAVDDQEIDSLQSIAGCQFSWTLSRAKSVLIPQVRVEWYHEFDNDSRLISAMFSNDPFREVFAVPTDDPDENYFAVSGGVSGVWQGGKQGFIEVETLQGLEDLTNYVVTAGIRFTL